MDNEINEIDRKIDVTAILFLLVQKRQQTHDCTLIGSGANGLGILELKVSWWGKIKDLGVVTLKSQPVFEN